MDTQKLEAFIVDKMSATGLPGLSLALIKDDQVVYARGFGLRDVINGYPATPNTLYSVGSVTKSFTVLAILMLVEEGKLQLDDSIDRYVPFDVKPRGESIQIRHLLSHTTGIPALAYAEAILRHASGMGGKALAIGGPEDIISFANDAKDWVETRPGERWFYFNEGYAMLGQIIEKVSGQPYNDFMHSRILEPLGMTRSFFTKAEVDAADDVAVPYTVIPNANPKPGRYLYRSIRSEGGLISSVMELSKAVTMYLHKGQGLLSEPLMAEMWQPQIPMPSQPNTSLFPEGEVMASQAHYASGLITEDFFGEPMVSHGGSVGVATAHMAFLPQSKLGVVLLINGSGYPTGHFARVALATLLEQDWQKLPFMRVESHLTPLTGHYETYKGTMTAQVQTHADFLKLILPGGAQAQEVILVPERLGEEASHFFTLTGGQRLPVSFHKRDGKVKLIFERYKFKRVSV